MGFLRSLKKNKVLFLLKKKKRPVFFEKNKKQVGCFFLKKTGFSQPWLQVHCTS